MMKFKNIATLTFASFALLACGGGGGGGGDSDDSGFVGPEQLNMVLTPSRTVLAPNYSGSSNLSYINRESVSYITIQIQQPNGAPYTEEEGLYVQLDFANSIADGAIYCFDAENEDCAPDKPWGGIPVNLNAGYANVAVASLSADSGNIRVVFTASFENTSIVQSIDLSVGGGSGDTFGVIWDNIGNMLTNDQRFVRVAVYDERTGPVGNTSNNNLSISVSGLADVTVSGNNKSGRAITGRNINISTIEGVSAISILSGNTTGILTLTATADKADNNVDNGIQEPVSSSTIISVVSSADQIGNSINLTATDFIVYSGKDVDITIPYSGSVSSMELVSGSLPAGLTFSNGTISGNTTELGEFDFTVVAYAPNGDYDTQTYNLTVSSDEPVKFENLSDSYDLLVGDRFSTSITVNATAGSTTFSIDSGSLPPGISFSNGTISGTPTTAGQYSVIIRASNPYYSGDAVQSVTFNVGNGSFTLGDITATATVGTAYSATISATASDSYTIEQPVSWEVTSGALPNNLALDPGTGVISGTPDTAGAATFTVTATDGNGVTASRIYTITVAP